ncbi:MAG TPA: hypothetical protein DF613_05315, partial [Lachnospiraceae bacterium]|nr:hypothetical protein [Lachnospiraceae bacterium]
DQLTPVKILGNVATVSLGEHSAAITTSGDLYCWGDNSYGQVGNGIVSYSSKTPVKVLENVSAVSLGWSYSAAITISGDLYCWGSNTCGQIGNGTTTIQLTPVKINLTANTPNPPQESETPDDTERKLQGPSSLTIEKGSSKTMSVSAYEDSLENLRALTRDVIWESKDANIAEVKSAGFLLPVRATTYPSADGDHEVWIATGMQWVRGIAAGTTTVTGTASDGSKVSVQVTVTEPEKEEGASTEGSGGSLFLGEDASGSGGSNVADFFPGNWSLKSAVFPIEIQKTEKEDGSYTLKGTVGIGKGDWLDDEAKWNKYKKNVSDANKYTGRVDCLSQYKEAWNVKSVTAVTTDKFEVLPKLSVMGYFENIYDKNDNLISAAGKLAADAKWSGSISWQFVTPIGPLYLNLTGSGKLSGSLGPKYDSKEKSLQIVDGGLKLTPSITVEGGYGIDKVATIGPQGTLSVPITIVPASKGELEAKASIHVKLVFVIDWTQNLATYKTTLWDTKKRSRAMGAENNIVKLTEGTFSEMDTSFADAAGAWNPGTGNRRSRALSSGIADTVSNSIQMLQEGILPSSLPMQVQIGGKTVLVFQAYDPARTTLNSSVLKYSVLENGVWSEPQAVMDDGCADLYADMREVNGKLALVWQKEKAPVAGNVEMDSEKVLKDMAVNAEIYFALFDEGTNSFSDPIRVTDNDSYDMMPQIVNGQDGILVSWVRNDEADLMQETGSNTIYTAKWNGSSFENEEVLSISPGTIDSYTVYPAGDVLQSVFTGHANGITAVFDTDGNVIDMLTGLMLASEDGKISSLHDVAGKVNFVINGTLYTYDPASKKLISAGAGESAFGSEVRYCSNGEKEGYIWSIYDEETAAGKILASMKTENGYSEPITLFEKEHTMWRYFSPAIDTEGTWHIIANALDTETGLNSLLYVSKKEESRLELAGASVDENDVVDGLTGIDYFVTNTEDTAIHTFAIEITLEDGSKVTKNVPVTLLPGESKAGTAYVDLSSVDTAQKVTLSVAAENQEDRSGCVVSEQIGLSDVAIEATGAETEEEIQITATLSNTSTADANVTLHLYSDEKKMAELNRQEGISLKANGNTQTQFTVSKKDVVYNENHAAYLTLTAEAADGDYNEDNNTAYVILYEANGPEDTDPPEQPDTPTPGTSDGQPGNPSAGQPEEQPGNPSTGQSGVPSEGQQSVVKTGYTATVNKMKYKVTRVNADGTGEVSLTGSSRKKTDKKFTSLKIADKVTINGKAFKVTAIGKGAFKGFTKLKSVSLGQDVTSIGDSAFYKCTALTRIVIPSKVLRIGKQAFGNCKKLRTLTLGKNVTAIGDKAFYKCTALTKVVIPSKVARIGKQAFYGCKKLKSITIQTAKLKSKSVGVQAFKDIHKKALIKVPKKQKKAYMKWLKKKGITKTMKIK